MPSSPAIELFNRADQANELRRYQDAVSFAQQAIAADPEFADSYAAMGRAYLGLDQPAEALECFSKALSLDPQSAWFLRCMGIAHRMLDQPQAGLNFLNQSLAVDPLDMISHCEQAKCLAAVGNFGEAQKAFEKSLELDPMFTMAWNGLGRMMLDQKKYVEGESYFRNSLDLEPINSVTLNNLGVCLERQNKLLEAALAFKSAVLLDPELKVAKSNTKLSVEKHLDRGTFGFGAAVFAFFFGLVVLIQGFAKDRELSVGVFLICLILSGIVFTHILTTRRKNRMRLEEADPQLMDIYHRILKFDKPS